MNNTAYLNMVSSVSSDTNTLSEIKSILGISIEYWIIILIISSIISIVSIFLSLRKRKVYIEDIYYKDKKSTKNLDDVIEFNASKIKDIQYLRNTIEKIEKQVFLLSQKSIELDDLNKTNQSQTISNTEKIKEEKNTTIDKSKDYIWLKVIDGGKLTISQSPDTAIYRAWENEGELFFEFSCLRTGKAINNRTSVIEPFCDIEDSAIDPDSAKEVIVKKFGKLAKDLSLIQKIIIQYK